jgi:hypothetical protein
MCDVAMTSNMALLAACGACPAIKGNLCGVLGLGLAFWPRHLRPDEEQRARE